MGRGAQTTNQQPAHNQMNMGDVFVQPSLREYQSKQNPGQ